MEKLREIAWRGHWRSGVYDKPPKIGPRLVRVDGEFATEADQILREQLARRRAGPRSATVRAGHPTI